jgi:hypothetical protein
MSEDELSDYTDSDTDADVKLCRGKLPKNIAIHWLSIHRRQLFDADLNLNDGNYDPEYYDVYEKGKGYSPYYFKIFGNDTTLEEALITSKKTPTFDTRCRIDYGYHGSIGEIIGPFSDTKKIEICFEYYKPGVSTSVISMEGCENFRNLTHLCFIFGYRCVRPVEQSYPLICLNGIEYCHSLKHLRIDSMGITSLTVLKHLQFHTLSVANNPINDLNMINTEDLTIDEDQLPLVLTAFASTTFKVRNIIVNLTMQNVRSTYYGSYAT